MPADDAAPVERILAALANSRAPQVVLIDGFSGAGKSTLADALVAAWPEVQLVRLEHIYPGWDGLDAASAAVHDGILVPFSSGGAPGWRRWDWETDAAAEWHPVEPGRSLLVEGAGVLSRANHALATLGVWVELDEATRKSRALARDGDTYAPHWERWAAHERAFAARERPQEIADIVVTSDG